MFQKEKEIIAEYDAVNSKEFYNVAPGGERRPYGFVMSDEEIIKMGYLNNQNEFEPIYACKISDKNNDDTHLCFHETGVENGIINGYSYMISDDTYNKGGDKNSLNNYRNVIHGVKNTVDWYHTSGYMVLPKEKYDRYFLTAIKSSEGFNNIYNRIKEESKKYFESLKSGKAITVPCEEKETAVNNKSLNMQYIEEYAKTNENYRNFLNLINRYPEFNFTVIYNALTGNSAVAGDVIRSGKLKCSRQQYDLAKNILDYERGFNNIKVSGCRNFFNAAIAFCYCSDEVDNGVLHNRIKSKKDKIPAIKSVRQAIEWIESVYNYRQKRSDKIHIKHAYDNRNYK